MTLSIGRSRVLGINRILAVGLDHDALSRALLSRLDHFFDESIGNPCEAACAVGCLFTIEHHSVAKIFGLLFHDPKTIVSPHENVRTYLLADPVTSAEILIYPNHQLRCISQTITSNSNQQPP